MYPAVFLFTITIRLPLPTIHRRFVQGSPNSRKIIWFATQTTLPL
jgi:hypothetical protein